MWPASKVCPKELFPLGKIPAIVNLVWELMDAGIEEVIIVTAGRTGAAMKALFDPSNAAPEKIAGDLENWCALHQVQRVAELTGGMVME